MLSYDEFKKLVRKSYDDDLSAFSKSERDEYFNSSEAQTKLKNDYERAVKKYKAGNLGDAGFRVGVVSATANCLSMMF